MNFLIDNQLPPALARFLQIQFNVRAMHVIDVGFTRWVGCRNKDEDFANMFLQVPTAKLIWVRQLS